MSDKVEVEGELKKRLSEDFFADLLIKYGPDKHCDGYDIITEKTHKVLGDCRKEFPRYRRIRKNEDTDKPSLLRYIMRFEDWFKKWFGTDKEELEK